MMALVACGGGGDCESLASFPSHEAALKAVKGFKFEFDYTKETAHKSSWIDRGRYLSCDDKTGFLIIIPKEDIELLFQNVPKSHWEGFVNADSHGTYVNENIIGQYPLKLELN